jgi:hypothetical protein
VQLAQELEGANKRIKELQTELAENLRSVRAEQVTEGAQWFNFFKLSRLWYF